MKMRSCNFCHTNTKNPENNLGIFCLITGRPKLNGYDLRNNLQRGLAGNHMKQVRKHEAALRIIEPLIKN